jgi:hypothetical protein
MAMNKHTVKELMEVVFSVWSDLQEEDSFRLLTRKWSWILTGPEIKNDCVGVG